MVAFSTGHLLTSANEEVFLLLNMRGGKNELRFGITNSVYEMQFLFHASFLYPSRRCVCIQMEHDLHAPST